MFILVRSLCVIYLSLLISPTSVLRWRTPCMYCIALQFQTTIRIKASNLNARDLHTPAPPPHGNSAVPLSPFTTKTGTMHFALPPRKTSHPPPYARPYRSSTIRRRQLQKGAVLASAAILIIYLLTRLLSSSPGRPPAGVPEVVVVTVLDRARMSDAYIAKIMENRDDYAARHGKADCPSIFSSGPPSSTI